MRVATTFIIPFDKVQITPQFKPAVTLVFCLSFDYFRDEFFIEISPVFI